MRLIELHEKEDIVELIKRDCQPYLKEVGTLSHGRQLWRGLHSRGGQQFGDWIKMPVRSDRLPTETPLFIHKLFNEYFQKNFGWPAREGVFVSPDINVANTYGKAFAVFPIDTFNYLWSAKIDDLYSDIGSDYDNVPETSFSEEDRVELFTRLDDGVWMNSSLKMALGKSHEIMIGCTEYYALGQELVDKINWNQV